LKNEIDEEWNYTYRKCIYTRRQLYSWKMKLMKSEITPTESVYTREDNIIVANKINEEWKGREQKIIRDG
jgi:hypothetical protein